MAESFRLIRPVGIGPDSVIWEAKSDDGEVVAVKSIGADSRFVHSNLGVRRVIKDNSKIHELMPFCRGGSILSILGSRVRNHEEFNETEIGGVLGSILKAVNHLHTHGMIHSNIKLSNMLVGEEDILLADMGGIGLLYSGATPPYWVAPELLLERSLGYSTKSDVWLFGVMALEMAYGTPPIHHQYIPMGLRSFNPVFSYRFGFTYPVDAAVDLHNPRRALSTEFKHMVSSCLRSDPAKRASVAELLSYPFFVNCNGFSISSLTQGLRPLHERYQNEVEEGEPLLKAAANLPANIARWRLKTEDMVLEPVTRAGNSPSSDSGSARSGGSGNGNLIFAMDVGDE